MFHFRKGQITVEFILVMIAVFILFSVLFQIYLYRQTETRIIREEIAARSLVEEFGMAINAIYLAGPGSSTIVFIPASLQGQEYTFSVDGTIVSVTWMTGYVSFPVLVPLQGNITQNTFVTIQNVYGNVIFV